MNIRDVSYSHPSYTLDFDALARTNDDYLLPLRPRDSRKKTQEDNAVLVCERKKKMSLVYDEAAFGFLIWTQTRSRWMFLDDVGGGIPHCGGPAEASRTWIWTRTITKSH